MPGAWWRRSSVSSAIWSAIRASSCSAARQRFLTAYDEAHEAKESDGRALLIIGKDEYPFPIPIVADAGAWRFDTAAG